jgi:hypothetical protein
MFIEFGDESFPESPVHPPDPAQQFRASFLPQVFRVLLNAKRFPEALVVTLQFPVVLVRLQSPLGLVLER